MMAETTRIAWCDSTWSPWIGCAKIHAGCDHCYAEAEWDKRRHRAKWGRHGTRSKTSHKYWAQPLTWEPRTVFPSLCDPFEKFDGAVVDHRGQPIRVDCPEDTTGQRRMTLDDLRVDFFRLIDQTPQITWILLTKRPGNIRTMWPGGKRRDNVWLVYSVSGQRTLNVGLPHLLACRHLVPILGLSLEPLLSRVDLGRAFPCGYYCDESVGHVDHPFTPPNRSNGGLDWVIVGGESGPRARPCPVEAIGEIVAQCQDVGIPCFVKQLGANPYRGDYRMSLRDKKGGDISEWSARLRVQDFPARIGE